MKQTTMIFTLAVLATVVGTSAQTPVKRYQRIEERIVYTTSLSNPFTDTELRLQVSAPAGRRLGSQFTWYGFFDGDGDVWKFRLLFDEPGNWSVNAAFFKPGTETLNGPTQQFTYTVSGESMAQEHGHVYIDEKNWRRYKFADGESWTPFSMLSVFLLDQTTANARQWIDAHTGMGVNVLGCRFTAEAYKHGFPAWFHYLKTDGTRATAFGKFDYKRFDVATWRHNEEILSYAHQKRMFLNIWFGISSFNAQYSGYGPRDESGGELGPLQKLFIKYYLARFATFTNWWHWPVDVEWDEAGNEPWHVAYAKEMQRLNPWKTLITCNSQRAWTLDGKEDGWDVATVQLYPTNSALVADCRRFVEQNEKFGIPVFNSDGLFVGVQYNSLDITRAVTAGWATLMAGGTFQFASHDGEVLANSWGTVWSKAGSTHRNLADHLGVMASFFNKETGISINRCDPHHNLVTVNGGGSALCQARPGELYYIWLDQGGTPTVNLADSQAIYTGSMYSCANPEAMPVSVGQIRGGGQRTLTGTPKTELGNGYLYVLQNESPTATQFRAYRSANPSAQQSRVTMQHADRPHDAVYSLQGSIVGREDSRLIQFGIRIVKTTGEGNNAGIQVGIGKEK